MHIREPNEPTLRLLSSERDSCEEFAHTAAHAVKVLWETIKSQGLASRPRIPVTADDSGAAEAEGRHCGGSVRRAVQRGHLGRSGARDVHLVGRPDRG